MMKQNANFAHCNRSILAILSQKAKMIRHKKHKYNATKNQNKFDINLKMTTFAF